VRFPEFGGQLLTEALQGLEHVLGFRIIEAPVFGDREVVALDEGVGRGGGPVDIGTQVEPFANFPQVSWGVLSGVRFTFSVCNVTVPRLEHEGESWFLGVESLIERASGLAVPEGCVPVKLIPECVAGGLHKVPVGSKAEVYHKEAWKVRCYEDVSKVEWEKYVASN